MRDALIIDAVRSPIGKRNGTLASVRADELAAQVLNRLVERLDLDAVTAKIDVEAIVERLDLAKIAQEVIDELDLAAIAMNVVEEIDLPRIVRESTGTMANETVEGIRAQGMNADQAVGRLVDRLLRRASDRDDARDGT